ncbi:MAG: hypothetical protein ACRDJU_09665, partial [Actinomycetota bacterium]
NCCGIPTSVRNLPSLSTLAYFGAVVAAMLLAPHLPKRGELLTDCIAFGAGAVWCGVNARRGGQAHCLVTAVGWLLLAAGAAGEALLGRSLIHGDEQLVFVAVLVAGLVFECLWFGATGSNRLGQAPSGTSAPEGSPAST